MQRVIQIAAALPFIPGLLPTKVNGKISRHQYRSLKQGQLELGRGSALGKPNPAKSNPRRRVCYCQWGITKAVKDNENTKFK